MKGLFISMEGSDGSGKSTQLKKMEEYLKEMGKEVLVTREPGGTPIAEKIRTLLLDPNNMAMTPWTEMFLYASARAQHLEERILPALAEGKIVICDRFVDSSIAYQGYGRELGEVVKEVNQIATRGVMPDVTFFLDLSPETGMKRKKKEEGHELDRLELQENAFHKKVYDGYIAQCENEKDRIHRISAEGSAEEVFEKIKEVLISYLG